MSSLRHEQEWSQAAVTMATAVRDLSDKQVAKAIEHKDIKTAALWADGGPARATLHAITGGLQLKFWAKSTALMAQSNLPLVPRRNSKR